MSVKLSDKIYLQMCWCNDTQQKLQKVGQEIENYLTQKGVDLEAVRDSDSGGYVDMVDYGRGIVSKEDLEYLFSQYISPQQERKIK